jgi:hypothetical protein
MSDVSLIVPLPAAPCEACARNPQGAHEAFRAAETGVLDELSLAGLNLALATLRKNTPPMAAT